jgi:hypothetical protein
MESSKYEKEREERIAKNKRRLEDLGIVEAAERLRSESAPKRQRYARAVLPLVFSSYLWFFLTSKPSAGRPPRTAVGVILMWRWSLPGKHIAAGCSAAACCINAGAHAAFAGEQQISILARILPHHAMPL